MVPKGWGARAVIVVVAAACLVVAGVRSTTELRAARDATQDGLPSEQEREQKPLRVLDVPLGVAAGAAALIPAGATYAILLGTTLPLNENQRIGIPDLLHYTLLPRRWRETVEDDVEWVIAYGTPTETIEAPIRKQTEVATGVVVVELDR